MPLKFIFAIDRYLGIVLVVLLSIIARPLGWVLRRDHSLQAKGDILVIKMLGGGSLVIALPALLGIRRTYPNAKMRLFTTRGVKPFAETLGVFDEVLVMDNSSIAAWIASGIHCIRECFGADTIIDLEVYSYLSTVLSLLTCARNRIGFFYEETGYRQRLHTHRVFFHAASPLYAHYDYIAQLLDAPVVPPTECGEHIKNTIGFDNNITFKPTTSRIAVGCGCSDLSQERKIKPQQWAKHVFAANQDKSREVVFLGTKSDYAEANNVINSVAELGSSGWTGTMQNLCGSISLADSLRMLAACDEFWGIDSSLLHYARLFGVKCKSFFGPTSPIRLRPIEGLKEDVHYRKTLCSPCIHLVSATPCHGNNLCMQWLFDTPDASDHRNNWIPVNNE